jgi:hypothetical protein
MVEVVSEAATSRRGDWLGIEKQSERIAILTFRIVRDVNYDL